MIITLQWKSQYEKLTKHPFLCIPSPQLKFYDMWAWCHWKETNRSFSVIDIYEEMELVETLDVNLLAAFKEFQFFEVKPYQVGRHYMACINTVVESTAIFNYWIHQNLITDNRFFRLGIFKDVFDHVPAGCHYYDVSYVCTCGEPGCDHILALLVNDPNGNCYVPFFVVKFYGICFDLHRLNKLHEENTPAEMERISHKEYEDNPESNVSMYPFYMKREDFRINLYTLKPNE